MATQNSPVAPEASDRHGFGWIPDLPDHRDRLYTAIRRAPAVLPQTVDLRAQCSPVEDQGQVGSCTANALAGALEFLEMKNGASFVDLSRLFIYYNERALEHTTRVDAGAYLRDGVKTLVKKGVCAEALWPYDTTKWARKPPRSAYKAALDHQILSYYRIEGVDQCRQCLAEGFPFVFGFSVYTAFMSAAVAQSGKLNMPKPNERLEGGHAVMGCGYDDAKKRFIVRNSWSAGWGMAGYFTMPYDYVASRNLSDDFWTIRQTE